MKKNTNNYNIVNNSKAKKVTTLYVDSDLVAIAKRKGINLSKTLTDSLRYYDCLQECLQKKQEIERYIAYSKTADTLNRFKEMSEKEKLDIAKKITDAAVLNELQQNKE